MVFTHTNTVPTGNVGSNDKPWPLQSKLRSLVVLLLLLVLLLVLLLLLLLVQLQPAMGVEGHCPGVGGWLSEQEKVVCVYVMRLFGRKELGMGQEWKRKAQKRVRTKRE